MAFLVVLIVAEQSSLDGGRRNPNSRKSGEFGANRPLEESGDLPSSNAALGTPEVVLSSAGGPAASRWLRLEAGVALPVRLERAPMERESGAVQGLLTLQEGPADSRASEGVWRVFRLVSWSSGLFAECFRMCGAFSGVFVRCHLRRERGPTEPESEADCARRRIRRQGFALRAVASLRSVSPPKPMPGLGFSGRRPVKSGLCCALTDVRGAKRILKRPKVSSVCSQV